jgi:hypothetical protein
MYATNKPWVTAGVETREVNGNSVVSCIQSILRYRASCTLVNVMYIRTSSARRRRSGGGPGEGCARTPVVTYFCLHAVGDGHHVAVPCLARWAAKRGTGSCDPWDQQQSGSHVRRVLENHNIRTRARGFPAQPFQYVFS